jgi:hypothetical protein
MSQAAASGTGPSLMLIEGSLTAIALALPFCLPAFGASLFASIERAFRRLARRRGLAVATVGFVAFFLRLAILPLSQIPQPFVPDDFSFLLAANTFASGRLTNPTPAMWKHFESIHITMLPSYMSMYFPAHGLVLAAGKVLFGHPWFGLLCVTALMCAAICWMLQAWLPPGWALLGGMLAVLRLGLFSYWINSYTGAGSITALGGALVLGAVPRFMRTMQFRDGLVLAAGIIILATSRPYEGLLLCLPVFALLVRRMLFGQNAPAPAFLLRRVALPLALIVAAGIWMGYYDYTVYGNAFTPPYKIDRATYSIAPYWIWESPRPEPVYRHKEMRDFYVDYELPEAKKVHSLSGFFSETLLKAVTVLSFFAGIALLPPLVMLRRVLADRRVRFLVICIFVNIGGALLGIYLFPHYLAPLTAAFYAVGLQGMRHLRHWKPSTQPAGIGMVRLIVAICVVMAVFRAWYVPLHLELPPEWTFGCYGPGPFGATRARVESGLEQLPGRQLVIVRYALGHDPQKEWVYNAPDIDGSKVVWAREMDTANNLELIRYYKDRKVWLVQPDLRLIQTVPYPLHDFAGAATQPDPKTR